MSTEKPKLSASSTMTSGIEVVDIATLRPYKNNARTHPKKQVKQIYHSLKRYGWTQPILITEDNEIVCGHGRWEAARLIGLKIVPIIRLSQLTPLQVRAYRLADNKIAQNAGWNNELLAVEHSALIELDCAIEDTGFTITEVDSLLADAHEASLRSAGGPDDDIPAMPERAITRPGDIWNFADRHRLICADSRMLESFRNLLCAETAALIFTDPPYNVPIDGHVCGLGRIRHREFAMGVGEMPTHVFIDFLQRTLGHSAAYSRNGAIAFVCMDWRHLGDIISAGQAVFAELKNICVWNKTNGGMGSFYRSKHEHILVFKVGNAPHTNNFGLGDTGRYRTNVWDYDGVNSFKRSRSDELAMHPTVKPVALVADAIKDCSRRGEIVLDCFAGSGTTLIAAEKTGRRARLIEYDPHYCDVVVRRFQQVTGTSVTLVETGQDFETVEETRCGADGATLASGGA